LFSDPPENRQEWGFDMNDAEDTRQYQVVVNDEDQYSIWWVEQPVPAGWHPDGFTGSRSECLEHVEQVWTDMRPRSVRLHAQSVG
jgi:MbtH protein